MRAIESMEIIGHFWILCSNIPKYEHSKIIVDHNKITKNNATNPAVAVSKQKENQNDLSQAMYISLEHECAIFFADFTDPL